MMKPLYKQPLVEAVILASGILCTVVLIHGVQNFIALGGKPVTSQIAQKSNPDLVNVAAGSCEGLGDIDKRGQNGSQDPAKVPTDAFNDFGMVKSAGLTPAPASDKKFGDNISTADRDALHINLDGLVDGSITLANVWSVSSSYRSDSSSAVHKNEVIAIRTTPGQVIKTPGSGRMILDGSNLSGMVMYVSDDGVRFANSRNDKPTGQEGYNLYIWGITPDPGLASRYQCGNETQNRQKMPEMHVGDPLGTAKSDFIYLALRDNGAFQDLLDTSWWNGRIKAGDTTGAAAPPGGGPIVLAGDVSNNQISGNIDLFDVETKHKGLLRTTGDVAVAGDSTTDIDPFPFSLEGKVPIKVAEGKQGANWLKGQIENFPNNGRFALILIGVEEVQNGNVNAEMPNAGKLSDYESNLDAIVKGVLKKGTIPVLQEVNDFNSQSGMEANRKTVNDAMARVAKNNNVPLVKTPYITATHMKEDGYHFNAAGEKLRNQILGVVNTKLIALAAGAAAPVPKTVSGKIKLNGTGTNYINIGFKNSHGDFEKSDTPNVASVDGAAWSIETDLHNFCISAIMWTSLSPDKSVKSSEKCGINPGDKDIELTINNPTVAAPAVGTYTISGHIILTGENLGTKAFAVALYNNNDLSKPVYNHWTHTLPEYGYSIPNLSAGEYTLQATLYKSITDFTKLGNQIERITLNASVTRNITLNVPKDETLPKYAITIKASKLTSESCPTTAGAALDAYCLLGNVFNPRKGILKLTIKDKLPSNEQYRMIETIEAVTVGINKRVRSVEIYEVSSASPISAGQVQSAQVGDNSIVFDPRLLDIKVTP